jgi:prolipoprotein diacylglyceryl transferase
MYPGLSDLLNDLFGTNFSVSFPPMFGTMVALSFLLGAWIMKLEMKRKEGLGLVNTFTRKTMQGEPASLSELIWNGVFGFLLGFKLAYIFLNSDEFFSDPPATILSLKGNSWFGLVVAAVFIFLKYREKQKLKLATPKLLEETVHPYQAIPELTMAAALGGLLGAKLFHIFEYWGDFLHDPLGMFFSGSGMTMYGGLIVGAITTILYARTLGISALNMCDTAAPALMLSYGTGRIGCQLSGDGDWGIVNTADMPGWLSFLPEWTWKFTYPHNVISEGIPIPGCEGRYCYELAEAVFPTPLYESVACILLFFLMWSVRKRIMIPGMMFSLYLILNGIERFLVESIRVNSKYHIGDFAFTQAQMISTLLFLTGLFGMIYLYRCHKKTSLNA